ncbi:Uncharacterized protein dnl_07670 [Desulfonema limicola]|uniref:Uncharacterized protein n=1 Tax=Desulfonema limicola TaxID=45656 RepID=A0A975B4C3_9BACT|nr:Uncharacterized protein dnl_07670 [Desulfonema limicola]
MNFIISALQLKINIFYLKNIKYEFFHFFKYYIYFYSYSRAF